MLDHFLYLLMFPWRLWCTVPSPYYHDRIFSYRLIPKSQSFRRVLFSIPLTMGFLFIQWSILSTTHSYGPFFFTDESYTSRTGWLSLLCQYYLHTVYVFIRHITTWYTIYRVRYRPFALHDLLMNNLLICDKTVLVM